MFDVNIATVLIVSLLVMVGLGVHIAIALGMTSALGIFLITGGNFDVVLAMLGSTAYESLRGYEFAVIPLFMLMGEFIGKSGAVTDVYQAIHRGLKRIPGRLAVATLLGNAIFSFVTGVSIASAAAFSRIAYPEMKRFGYHRGFALGTIAGSSCLGMLIPPSVLMIVWGLLTERSIGQIFLAGVFPGLLLVSLFVAYVLAIALLRPELVGTRKDKTLPEPELKTPESLPSAPKVWGSAFGIIFVIVAVLGGIWFGVFTPTEGAGAGAFIGLIMAIAKGMRTKEIVEAIRACDLFILAISRHSTGSKNVVKELALASEREKIILPIYLEQCDIPKNMEYQLAGIQNIALYTLEKSKAYEFVHQTIRRLGVGQAQQDEQELGQAEATTSAGHGTGVGHMPPPKAKVNNTVVAATINQKIDISCL